jgi:hypothetical protein
MGQKECFSMTRDDVLRELWASRQQFDKYLSEIPVECLAERVEGHVRPVKDVVWHVAAYDELMVSRIRAARGGDTTAFDRDRVGWQAFNERIWAEAVELDTPTILHHADEVFLDLLEEVGQLTDDDVATTTELVAHLDPAWLQGRTLAELIGVDGFEHYPQHIDELRAAASRCIPQDGTL